MTGEHQVTSGPELVYVACWGELAGERKLPGMLRVLVGSQHAGAVERAGNAWRADW